MNRLPPFWRPLLAALVIFCLVILSRDSFLNTTRLHGQNLRAGAKQFSRTDGIFEDHDHELVKRIGKSVNPASDDVYDKAIQKGKTLVCYMSNPSSAGALVRSKWTQYGQLADWGWVSRITTTYSRETESGVKDLVGNEQGKQGQTKHKSGQADVEVEGETWKYPPTLATYENKYYPEAGIIIGYNNFGPGYMIKHDQTSKHEAWDPNVDHIPQLQQLSDIWFLEWQEITKGNIDQQKGLKYIIQQHVSNDVSKSVLARAMQAYWPEDPDIKEGRATSWPGKVFTKDMDHFAALLGSPNVWGAAYLAIQRGKQIGRKRIKSITAWDPTPDLTVYEPNLRIEFEAADDQ